MTAQNVSHSEVLPDASSTIAPAWLQRLEAALERIGDRLNPILVKEARQAMKSRHFSITFCLLLVCGWAWSLFGVAMRMPAIYYAPTGMFMLVGYYFILVVPMLLVVPFSAFRSLAGEREDGTYELLSISTLSARQIVTGKLGSAILQMLVFYSALAPCIAFTYLLRGVDIISILLLLLFTFCLSLILSAAGLVFAGLARSRQWHTLVSVMLLLALGFVTWMWSMFVGMIVSDGMERMPLDEPLFWWCQLALLTAWATYVVLLILAAAAQNSFPSDNRSTRLRVVMLVQTALYAGWIAFLWLQQPYWPLLAVAMMFAAIHWYFYGTLMTAESARLSPRVCRQLPMSFMGRVFLTWFNPGSGTGYVFAVSNLTVLVVAVLLAVAVQSATGYPNPLPFAGNAEVAIRFALLLLGYTVAYLGVGRLVILMIPRRERYGLLLPFLVHILIALAGCALPYFWESWRQGFTVISYSAWQTTNWLWTLARGLDGNNFDPVVELIVYVSAAMIFLLNLLLAHGEIEAVRQETPQRVQQEK